MSVELEFALVKMVSLSTFESSFFQLRRSGGKVPTTVLWKSIGRLWSFERVWSLKILVLQMSFFQFYMPRSVLNSPKSNFPSPFGSAASIISCVQEDSSEEVVSKCMSLKVILFQNEMTRSSWPQVGGSWQISGFHKKIDS